MKPVPKAQKRRKIVTASPNNIPDFNAHPEDVTHGKWYRCTEELPRRRHQMLAALARKSVAVAVLDDDDLVAQLQNDQFGAVYNVAEGV